MFDDLWPQAANHWVTEVKKTERLFPEGPWLALELTHPLANAGGVNARSGTGSVHSNRWDNFKILVNYRCLMMIRLSF